MDYYNPVIDYYNPVKDYYNLLLRFEPCLNLLGLTYRLLVLGHRNLIKNMKQTAVINIVKNHILLT